MHTLHPNLRSFLFLGLLSITSLAYAQFELSLEPFCDDPYSVFKNYNLPEVIKKSDVKSLGLKSVIRYDMSFDSKGEVYVQTYYKTEFDSAARITSHTFIDSNWIEPIKSWNLGFYFSKVHYTQEKVDSIQVLSLSGCRHMFRGNSIYQSTCYPLKEDVENYAEYTKRKFDKRTEKHRPYTAHWESASYLVSLANMDLMNSPSLGYDYMDFTKSDTIWSLPKPHRIGHTTILNEQNLFVREVFRLTIPEFIHMWESAPRIDYIYDLQGRLIRKRYINFENRYRGNEEFYFYNDDGLISSIWKLSEGRLELKSKFLFEKGN